MGNYDIFLGQEPVGKAEVHVEGLYYRFCCQCSLSGQVMFRLVVSCGNRQEKLGVPVPRGDHFVLEKRVAIKHLGSGDLHFRLLPKHAQSNGRFVPLSPQEPFAYLTKLRGAYLARQDGKVGIVLQEEPIYDI